MSMLETYGILPGETFNGLQNGRGRGHFLGAEYTP